MDLPGHDNSTFLEAPTLQTKIKFFACDVRHCTQSTYLYAFLWQNTLPKSYSLFFKLAYSKLDYF